MFWQCRIPIQSSSAKNVNRLFIAFRLSVYDDGPETISVTVFILSRQSKVPKWLPLHFKKQARWLWNPSSRLAWSQRGMAAFKDILQCLKLTQYRLWEFSSHLDQNQIQAAVVLCRNHIKFYLALRTIIRYNELKCSSQVDCLQSLCSLRKITSLQQFIWTRNDITQSETEYICTQSFAEKSRSKNDYISGFHVFSLQYGPFTL